MYSALKPRLRTGVNKEAQVPVAMRKPAGRGSPSSGVCLGLGSDSLVQSGLWVIGDVVPALISGSLSKRGNGWSGVARFRDVHGALRSPLVPVALV